jgi:glutathione S-transferase
MKLYGSTTSPFVRRIRLYLAAIAAQKELEGKDHAASNYQFINLDVFSEQGRKQLVIDNPTLKVPYLIDDDQHIFDSRVIYRYLAIKFAEPALSWREENLLTLIDSANDSFVSLFLTRRSGLDNKQDCLFFNLQNERVAIVLTELNQAVKQGQFKRWFYPAICLFSLLDWAMLRELYPFSEFSALINFTEHCKIYPAITETDPRN